MCHADLEHHFAGPGAGVGAIGGFGAQNLDAHLPEIAQVLVAENPAAAGQDRLGHALGLGRGVDGGERQGGDRAPAVGIGRRHLVAAGAPQPLAALDPHPIGADLFERDTGPVADHVGQQIGPWIADFIEHLFAGRTGRHQTAGIGRLGHDKTAVFGHLDDGHPHVVPARYVLPVGEIAPRPLRAAFDQMARQGPLAELVPIFVFPAEFVHQRA